jgi:hypothetical protein
MSVGGAVGKLCNELRGPAVFRVFNPGTSARDGIMERTTIPEDFFLAAGELLSAVIVVSWIISFIAQPVSPICEIELGAGNCANVTVFQDNALKRRIGYNNLCVGFDTPPAKYVCAVTWIFIAYCGFRFALLDLQRTMLVKKRLTNCKICFSIFTDAIYVFAWALFILTFVIPPWKNVWGHSIGFMFLGCTTWLVLLANVLEGRNMSCLMWTFVVIYGILTFCDFGLAGINFVYYNPAEGRNGPWNPWWVGAIFDYGWFGSLAVTSLLLPNSEGLKEVVQVDASNTVGNPYDEEDEEGGGLCSGAGDVDSDEEEYDSRRNS